MWVLLLGRYVRVKRQKTTTFLQCELHVHAAASLCAMLSSAKANGGNKSSMRSAPH